MKMISIVVSVYNEELVLDKFITAFNEIKPYFQWDYELIFVNDGSVDRSLSILNELSEKCKAIKIISFSKNFGHEAAMLAGIDHAKGDGIICMDADLQHPVQCIPEIIDKFENGFDIINMVRIKNESSSLIKNITSRAFYKLVNVLLIDTSFQENASDFFAINRRVAEVLRNNYREKTRFLRGYVQSVGFKKTTLEYVAAERAGGSSHYTIRKLLRFAIGAIVCFSDFPLKLGIYAGGMAALIGMAVLIYTLFTYHGAPSGYATIVILICLLFAVMFVVIGIIGEYMAILFSEIKDRPIYIIEKTINLEKGKQDEMDSRKI